MFKQEQWHEVKTKHINWDDLIMYAKVAWVRVVNLLRLISIKLKPFLIVSMKLEAVEMFFIDGI